MEWEIRHSTTTDLKVAGGSALPKSHGARFRVDHHSHRAGALIQLTRYENITAIFRAGPIADRPRPQVCLN